MKSEYLLSTDPLLNPQGIESDFLASEQRADVHEDDLVTLHAYFEHGQWWITVDATGESWSVVTVVKQNGEMVLGFEAL